MTCDRIAYMVVAAVFISCIYLFVTPVPSSDGSYRS